MNIAKFIAILLFFILPHQNAEAKQDVHSNNTIQSQKNTANDCIIQTIAQTKANNDAKHNLEYKLQQLVENYKSDNHIINQVYKDTQKGFWNQAFNCSTNESIQSFVEMIKASKMPFKEESYDEYEIYNFLAKKYPSLQELNLESKIKKAKYFVDSDGLDESGISPTKLLEKHKKDPKIKQKKYFQEKVRDAWYTKKITHAHDERDFLIAFSSILTNEDHIKRLNNMLWRGDIASAERVFKKVDAQTRTKAKHRIEILKSQTVDELFKNFRRLEKTETSKQILLFDTIKWCNSNNAKDRIPQLLRMVPLQNRIQNTQWWELIRPQIRDLLLSQNKDDHYLAYQLASHHGISEKTIEYVDSEFFAGFISYAFIKKYNQAAKHFLNSLEHAKQDFRKSRAAYWLGMTYDKLNQTTKNIDDIKSHQSKTQQSNEFKIFSDKYFKQASTYSLSFYGQLALEKFGILNNLKSKISPISEQEFEHVTSNPVFQYYYYSLFTRNSSLAKKLAKIATLSCQSKGEIVLLAWLANYFQMPDISQYIGVIAMNNMNYTILEALYPAPNYKYINENQVLTLSVIKRESNFENSMINDAGSRGKAHGLMQIIPEARIDISKGLGVSHNHNEILHPEINVMYGSYFLKHLINKWNNSFVLAISSYNAGAGSTNKWINKLGDYRCIPKQNIEQKLIWLEQIPFRETRYYVQSVISSMTIYNTLLYPNKKLKVVLD